MKAIILLILAAAQAFGGYSFTRKITIDHTRVLGTLTNYPIGITGTYSYLKTVGNGGNVQSSSGYDIVFSSDAANTTPLGCEMENWSASTGVATFWIKIPSVSNSVDTTFYIHYGNAAISTLQCTVGSAWESNFKAVYHFGSTSGFTADSTSNGNSLSNYGSVASGTGLMGDGAAFGSANALWMAGNPTTTTSAWTLEAWLSSPTSGNYPTSVYNGVWGVSGYALITESVAFQCVVGSTGGGACNGNSLAGWYYWVGTASSGSSTVYVGQTGGSFTNTTGSITNSTPTTIFAIGAAGVTATPTFQASTFVNKTLDEVRVSSIDRSAAWIETTYNNIKSPSTFSSIGPAISSGNSVFPILYEE